MPPSLNKDGPTSIVPIKCPDWLKTMLLASLEPGEKLSELTRRLWADEVDRRAMLRDPKPPKRKEIKRKPKSGE
jgi:hypothetical protein